MLKFIKNLLGFSKNVVEPAKKNETIKQHVSQAKPKSQNYNSATRPATNSRYNQPQSHQAPKTATKRHSEYKNPKVAKAPTPPKEVAIKPLELNEVEVIEGKKRFLDYDIDRDILFGLQKLEFKYCTPIQEMTLDFLLAGKDIAGKAQTGTGKTAAFLISTFNHLLKNPKPNQKNGTPRCLILAPTRELAMQIHKDAEIIGIFTKLRSMVVFGGMDHEKQREQLDDPIDILIGTPGRVIDYSNGSTLNLGEVEILILDEADRMLDMGFIPDVRRIISRTPNKKNRQTMLFSATLDDSILKLAEDFLNEPEKLESEPDNLVAATINQTFFTVSGSEKIPVLINILRKYEYERIIIFGNRKDINLVIQKRLAKHKIFASLLSGDVQQEKRIKILSRFRDGLDKILIATDVAARGIHVDNVSIVINYDLPERPDDYVHRIGRTGRAGKEGISISFLCEYGAYNLDGIEQLLNTKFKSVLPPEDMLIVE